MATLPTSMGQLCSHTDAAMQHYFAAIRLYCALPSNGMPQQSFRLGKEASGRENDLLRAFEHQRGQPVALIGAGIDPDAIRQLPPSTSRQRR